jgi:hypothetical protein
MRRWSVPLTVRTVAAGEAFLSPAVTRQLLDQGTGRDLRLRKRAIEPGTPPS